MTESDRLRDRLLTEVLRDAHRYAHGIEQGLPTVVASSRSSGVRRLARERSRDLLERVAARAGFSRRHFDPDGAARRLARILELASGLEATYARLGDEDSRRAMIDVLKLRVLGPHHAPLRVTPQSYKRQQRYADRELRISAGTFEVSDPYFSPLSLYRVPDDGGEPVSLHSHSVDLVSVFLLNQYSYERGAHRVSAEPGEVVLDIGGCWGDTALYLARRIGARGRVYTFEFDPESLEILAANLALNPAPARRIEVVSQALWSRSDENLEVAQAGRMTSVRESSGDQTPELRAETITLDDFVQRRGLERVDFIKLDVEGAELDVIAGAGETLRRFAPKLAIAVYHKDDDLVRIPEALIAANPGYRFYLDSFSAAEDETILFGRVPEASSANSRT